MPYETTFDMLPMGHAEGAVKKEGESVAVRMTAFFSTEDGQEFVHRLEGFPSELLAKSPTERRTAPSQVDHLLAIIRRDRTATVYVNELNLLSHVIIGRTVQAGEHIFKNDIVDIDAMEFDGVTVPDDAGVALVFSVGWRKGYYFDFSPLHPKENIRRSSPFPMVFGHCYSHVLFQERLRILDSEWEAMLRAKWFPFAGVKHETIDKMLAHLRAGWDVDELLPKISSEVKERLPSYVEGWRTHPAFSGHLAVLEKAAEHFNDGDYLSASGLLFPRIEGLLRANHELLGSLSHPSQKNLSTTAVQSQTGRTASLLLPHKFEQYLQEVFFADFNPGDKQIAVSRNSVGHGVASIEELNEKAAVIGLLVTQQLRYCFGRKPESSSRVVEISQTGGLPPAPVPTSLGLPNNDWQRTAGMFDGSDFMREVDAEVEAMREAERKAAHEGQPE